MRLIGLDVGTTGCKALLIDPDAGKVLSRSFREYGIDADAKGKAEQDAEQVWILAKTVLREALERAGFPGVAALSLSVQGDAVIPIDADGNALHPAILGMDYRCQSEIAACAEHFDGFELFRRTGMRPHPINSFLKALWLRRERPEVFARTARIVTYTDFLMGKLGCPGVIDTCMASRSMAFNAEALDWDREVLAAFSFPERLFSKPVPSAGAVGVMSRELTNELGLPSSPTIVAGGHDQPVCALGGGAITPDIAIVSTGTAEVLSRVLARPLLTREMYDSYYPCYCSAMGYDYFTFALNHTGGLSLRWFKDAWCGEEIAAARAADRDPYDVIIGEMPKGPSGVFVMPHFTGSGTPTCDFNSRAAVVGLTLDVDRPKVGLALLEGLVYELRLNIDRMRELGMPTARLRAVGGGARSPRWLQLKADILNVPVDTMEVTDAGCIGAAVLAGVGSGMFASVAEGVERLIRVDASYEPNPRDVAAYDECFGQYRKLHGFLKPFYDSLADPARQGPDR